ELAGRAGVAVVAGHVVGDGGHHARLAGLVAGAFDALGTRGARVGVAHAEAVPARVVDRAELAVVAGHSLVESHDVAMAVLAGAVGAEAHPAAGAVELVLRHAAVRHAGHVDAVGGHGRAEIGPLLASARDAGAGAGAGIAVVARAHVRERRELARAARHACVLLTRYRGRRAVRVARAAAARAPRAGGGAARASHAARAARGAGARRRGRVRAARAAGAGDD